MPFDLMTGYGKPMVGLLALGLVLTSGCSKPEFEVAPTGGVVTLDGEPLTTGKVMFAPKAAGGGLKAGKTGFGVIGPEGRYDVSTYGAEDGAVVAKHTVTVINSEPDSESGQRLQVERITWPQRLVVEPGKQNEFDIELTTELLQQRGMKRD
ncbi:hypothetical protein Mal64_20020 [Pseudobythopirellula maris]|uniref:Carboxypeptidase regulatory-like domain-containing protein n=1 Tax=Pseudobythopirellula maris TaxID=2527991 RepID=A0A5C5ZM93_9BACT|nr:hypothetical protein [Pseudobythopirellula maris]TWT88519.1 hypothetical protein Mal64_20020 [Pseudobythopirellula maris]